MPFDNSETFYPSTRRVLVLQAAVFASSATCGKSLELAEEERSCSATLIFL